MPEVLTQLVHLRDLASLEGFARLPDLEALLNIARVAPFETRVALLETAGMIYAASADSVPVERTESALSLAFARLIALVRETGLERASFAALEAGLDRLLTALEDAHRKRQSDPLEAAAFVALEEAKSALFGRVLNVAERARMRGLYERTKLLKSW